MRKTMYKAPNCKQAQLNLSLGYAATGGVIDDAGNNRNFGMISGGIDNEFGE